MIKSFVLAAMLLSSTAAYAQYQGSAQPNGSGGYNFYGADGRFTGSAQPNSSGGANFYAPVQPAPTYVPQPPTGFMPLPCSSGRRC